MGYNECEMREMKLQRVWAKAMAAEMKKGNYRITTDGIRYRVECLQWCGWLWWRKRKWKPMVRYSPGGMDDYVPHFPSLEKAHEALGKCVAEEKARRQGFQPVPEQENHAGT